MNYIVFDLEFNQSSETFERKDNKPALTFEIIQIGAIKLDKKLETIDTLNSFIKPEVYTSINPYVEKITGISLDSLINAQTFKDVFHDFINFCDKDSILCVWGLSDIKELYRNILYHNLDVSLIPKLYINIQKHTCSYFNFKKGINIGLASATEILNIKVIDKFHDAFNDALYTSEVFKKIYSKDIVPKKYIFNKVATRTLSQRSKLDTIALFKQFEKMFSRELSSEEKSMIELAYKMGKTNQFQINKAD